MFPLERREVAAQANEHLFPSTGELGFELTISLRRLTLDGDRMGEELFKLLDGRDHGRESERYRVLRTYAPHRGAG